MPLNILDYDPYLEPFKEDLSLRLFEFARTKKRLVRLLILLMVISILASIKKVNTGLFANGHQMLKELGWLEISIIGKTILS